VTDNTPVTVQNIVVNDGNAQRSKVTSLNVTFSELVTIDSGAFDVLGKGTGQLVAVAFTTLVQNGQTIATLTFSGDQTDYTSLKDGEYQLTVYGSKVHDSDTGTNLDGDNNGTFGGDRVFGAAAIDKFFRKFGDSNGDRAVDAGDYARFKMSLGNPAQYKWYLDFNGDGNVDAGDLARFKMRLGN
jgi:hypothetical protein